MKMALNNKRILLIISGGIAAYKALELIRLLKKDGASVRCILTKGGEQFITPLSVASLSGEQVYTDLWSLKDETEMGHIRLSREADLVVVAPASADIIAKMAHGMANDLATTTLLATDKPVMVAPAMNQMMWTNAATQDNVKTLQSRGIAIVGPGSGEMACGETGEGRLIEPEDILAAISDFFFKDKPLAGLKALITAGPTHEPIDPIRFIGNRSSGKQGYAIARHLRDLGADVTLVSGPVNLAPPEGVKTIRIQTAKEMLAASMDALPADIAICTAAVADWGVDNPSDSKLKKDQTGSPPALNLSKNPDILASLSALPSNRPNLVVGFAAETDNVLENAKAKLASKGCDFVVANPVNTTNPVFGSDHNQVYFLSSGKTEEWPRASKDDVARQLCGEIVSFFASGKAAKIAAE
jgi:phosphopantothenoylcysteine decarboxylase/phosphopantothenate--cysteine ligase